MSQKEKAAQLFVLIIGIVVYSLSVFAYMNANFSSKELMKLILERQVRIENKLDRLIEREIK